MLYLVLFRSPHAPVGSRGYDDAMASNILAIKFSRQSNSFEVSPLSRLRGKPWSQIYDTFSPASTCVHDRKKKRVGCKSSPAEIRALSQPPRGGDSLPLGRSPSGYSMGLRKRICRRHSRLSPVTAHTAGYSLDITSHAVPVLSATWPVTRG